MPQSRRPGPAHGVEPLSGFAPLRARIWTAAPRVAQQPRVGRQSICALEAAQNLIAAQPREPGQVCETGASRRVVSEALADLWKVAGWRIAPSRRAMRSEER